MDVRCFVLGFLEEQNATIGINSSERIWNCFVFRIYSCLSLWTSPSRHYQRNLTLCFARLLGHEIARILATQRAIRAYRAASSLETNAGRPPMFKIP